MHVFVLESVRDFYNFRVNHGQFYVNGNTDHFHLSEPIHLGFFANSVDPYQPASAEAG